MNRPSNANDKLVTLRKKEAALRAAIATERVRQQRRREKEDERLFAIVGSALVTHGAKAADFKVMLLQVLSNAVTDETSRKFLSSKGWL